MNWFLCFLVQDKTQKRDFKLAERAAAWYSVREMNKKTLLFLSVAAVAALPMCQQFNVELHPAGMVTAQDTEADGLLSAARDARKAGKIGKAIKDYKEIVYYHALAPNAAQARYELAECYEALKDYREAFRQYDRLIDMYPQSTLYRSALDKQLAMAFSAAKGEMQVDVFWGLWRSNMESGVVIEWLRSIINKAPHNDMAATASSILAGYLVQQDREEEARVEYARLVEKYPDSPLAPEAQLMVAQLWANSSLRGESDNLVNLARAREAYEEFSLRFPNHKDARKALGQAATMEKLLVQQQLEVGRYYLERSREYTSAIFCLEDVIRQKSINPEAAATAQQLLEKARAAQTLQRNASRS